MSSAVVTGGQQEDNAVAYAEAKGIYALLQHLALALLEGPPSSPSAGDQQHQRPQDPLAFLAAYAASAEGQANLSHAVADYTNSRRAGE